MASYFELSLTFCLATYQCVENGQLVSCKYQAMADLPETLSEHLEQAAKGWAVASFYSIEKLRRIYKLEGADLQQAIAEGRLVLETTCLFVHACVKHGQYR